MSACAGCARLTAERDAAKRTAAHWYDFANTTAQERNGAQDEAAEISAGMWQLTQERDALAARVTALEGALRDVLESFDADFAEPAFDLWITRLAIARTLLTTPRGSARPPAALEGR